MGSTSKNDVQMKWVEMLEEMAGNGYDIGASMKCHPFILFCFKIYAHRFWEYDKYILI